jgi:anti-sigma B factor antagonist
MKLETKKSGNVLIVRPVDVKSLDAQSSPRFREELLELTEREDNLILNMKNVEFMDSSGLGAVISGFKNLSRRGGEIKLVALAPDVRSLFEITRLHRVFEIYPDEETALASF